MRDNHGNPKQCRKCGGNAQEYFIKLGHCFPFGLSVVMTTLFPPRSASNPSQEHVAILFTLLQHIGYSGLQRVPDPLPPRPRMLIVIRVDLGSPQKALISSSTAACWRGEHCCVIASNGNPLT